MSKIIGFVALAVLAVGCAATPDQDEPSSSSDADLTATKWFDCSDSGGEQMSHVEIGMTPTKLTVTDLSKDAAPPTSGKIDPTYHPTSATYAESIRYSGFNELAQAWDEVSTVDFMVSKEIQDGKAAGKIWMRTAGPEGGGTSSLWCKAKAKPLKVDPAKKARFNCDLAMLCTNDNPPGQTCLDAAFIQQTDAKTTKIRTEYLDHFGVHVVVRKVEVGSSDGLKRDAKSYSADVSGTKIKLDYRAGVTYTGTFTLPDGRSTKATCNDLAMLDD